MEMHSGAVCKGLDRKDPETKCYAARVESRFKSAAIASALDA
jgi:hypothetical protein